MRIRTFIATALVAGAAGFGSAGAAVAETDESVLAGTCFNCHGTEGRSTSTIPAIAGQPYDVLLAQLQAFKAGEVPGATVMTRLARGYSDEEIETLARYFSQVQP